MGLQTVVAGEAVSSGASRLWYEAGALRKPVPSWAETMIDLGAACAGSGRSTGERLIAAIAVPTREYCAVMAAVGAVGVPEPVTSREIVGADAIDAHFRSLSGLRHGAAVTVGRGSGVSVGKFEGVDASGAEPMVVIRQPKFVQRIPKRSCDLIRPRGRYFGSLLVGRINVLEAEICEPDVVTSSVKPLQTLLKVARFSRSPRGATSEIIAPGFGIPGTSWTRRRG